MSKDIPIVGLNGYCECKDICLLYRYRLISEATRCARFEIKTSGESYIERQLMSHHDSDLTHQEVEVKVAPWEVVESIWRPTVNGTVKDYHEAAQRFLKENPKMLSLDIHVFNKVWRVLQVGSILDITSGSEEFWSPGGHTTVLPPNYTAKQLEPEHSGSKYHRIINSLGANGTMTIDVYCVLEAFNVTNPGLQHAIKKLLCAGIRGKGDVLQDLKEAIDAIGRAITIESTRKAD